MSEFFEQMTLFATAITLMFVTLLGAALTRVGLSVPNELRRLGRVDGLRGYLALFVMVHHTIVWLHVTWSSDPWGPPTEILFNNFGRGAVSLFFMTTGFLFYPRILRGLEATDWAFTYISRLFRIYPMVVFVVIVVIAVTCVRLRFNLHGGFRENAVAIFEWLTAWAERPLFGDQDTGRLNAYVLWSLRYELLFYVFVLPGMALARDLTRRFLPSWLLPTLLGLTAVVARPFFPGLGILPFLPLFAIGMLAYELRQRDRIVAILSSRLVAVPATICLVVAAVNGQAPWDLPQIIGYGVFFACVACDNDLSGILSSKGALALGEISYPIYMLHGLVLDLIFVDVLPGIHVNYTWGILILLPTLGAMVTVLSAVVSIAVERPSIRIGKQISARISRDYKSVPRSGIVS